MNERFYIDANLLDKQRSLLQELSGDAHDANREDERKLLEGLVNLLDHLADRARLIAAAPELLEACKAIDGYLHQNGLGVSVARRCAIAEQVHAAISKAEGGAQ